MEILRFVVPVQKAYRFKVDRNVIHNLNSECLDTGIDVAVTSANVFSAAVNAAAGVIYREYSEIQKTLNLLNTFK